MTGLLPDSADTQNSRKFDVLTVSVMLICIVLAWLASVSISTNAMNMETSRPALPILTMAVMFTSPRSGTVSFFLFVWVIGMIAMMFPAMIPVVLIYTKLVARTERRPAVAVLLGTPLFLAGYLLVYAILGTAAFVVISAGFHLSDLLSLPSVYMVPSVAAVLIVTGVWQLTPLKDRCLSKCVSPFSFFLTHAKKGLSGAFRMGTEHGYYCAGCCWMYMLVMLAVAAMSVPTMILLTALITVEKAVIKGAKWFRWMTFWIFTALGSALLLFPNVFI